MSTLVFELICVSTSNKPTIKTESNLVHFLLSNGNIWENPEKNNNKISEKNISITCKVEKISSSDEDSTNIEQAFKIISKGKFNDLEEFRLKLLSHIDEKFNYKYVTKDQVSKKIARDLYPLINDLESELRGYLITFFVSKLGVKWWDLNADDKMKSKANQRKNNEKDFSKYIDNKVYLIDFRDLGEMVYSQSSGYGKLDEIIKKIEEINEEDDNIKEKILSLKEDIKTNYNKFFKEFKDGSFQDKWQNIEKLRNKVAHNNLFTKKDLDQGKLNCSSLLEIIVRANEISEGTNFSEEEQESIVELSIINRDSEYGEFIKSWQSLRMQSIKLFNDNHENKTRLYSKGSNKMFKDLLNQSLIEREIYEEIMILSKFRNSLVHTPNDEGIESNIPEMIKKLNKVIEQIKNT